MQEIKGISFMGLSIILSSDITVEISGVSKNFSFVSDHEGMPWLWSSLAYI